MTTSAGAPDRYLCMPVISNIASQNVLHTVSPMPAFDSDWKNAEDTRYLQTLHHRNHLLPQDNSDILPDKVHISDTLLPNTDDHALSDLDVSEFQGTSMLPSDVPISQICQQSDLPQPEIL